MHRHYYISDNLDELEYVEKELEDSGISTEQIHVLSEQDAAVARHHLHDVSSVMKQDLVRSARGGAFVGLALALLVMGFAASSGLTASAAGWLPFIFLALVLVGFAAWEGGLIGLQRPNAAFRPFTQSLHEGKHLFFIDVKPAQEAQLQQVLSHHPSLQVAGIGAATPDWLLAGQQRWHQFRRLLGGL